MILELLTHASFRNTSNEISSDSAPVGLRSKFLTPRFSRAEKRTGEKYFFKK